MGFGEKKLPSTKKLTDTVAYYSIKLIAESVEVFSGFFSLDTNTNTVTSFFNVLNPYTNILNLVQAQFTPNYIYVPGWLALSFDGTTVTTLPFINLASNYNLTSTGDPETSNQGLVSYFVGENQFTVLISFDIQPISGPIVCFNEGSKILTDKGYLEVEKLKEGDLVKTLKHNFVPIKIISKKLIQNDLKNLNGLYICKKEKYPDLFEDLIITGCHSILVDELSLIERIKAINVNGKIYVTDNKYRLPAAADEKAERYIKNPVETIYHLALENENERLNYGIYANGLLVESCSIVTLKNIR